MAIKRLAKALLLSISCVTLVSAQESHLQSDFRREREEFKKDCGEGGAKAIFGCAKDLFTGQPLHIAIGSIAPQNGFGFGPSFVFGHNTPNWRFSLNSDAVVSSNASWRAGAYMKAVFIRRKGLVATDNPNAGLNLVREFPVVHFYAQGISLNAINFYGLGGNTQRSSQAIYGMRETIAGANVLYPIIPKVHLSLFGELNGRFVNIRDGGTAAMALSKLYTNTTAPGLVAQPGFFQAGEGIRFQPPVLGGRIQPDLSLTYQQFVASGSKFSFQRLNTDVGVEAPLYHARVVKTRSYNGPDECGSGIKDRKCPVVMDRTGSIGLRLLISQSMTPAGNTVPFYFQPTLGGADLNGQKMLPAYADYRFRGPNMIAVRANFEHSIYGPLGFQFLYDIGKVTAARSDLDFTHMSHSFGAGLTLRAGGLPEVSFLFAFGGGEGTHTMLMMNNSLLGGGGRPSLF
jgi:hypothetical protein